MRSTRDAYGEALVKLGTNDDSIFAVDADLACSTQSKKFADKFPDRFVNVGCAEQDLMGTAAGLAISGKKVFASTHAFFATGRPWDQIRTIIAHDKLDVKIVASHGGMTNGSDGYTHHALEDIGIMRIIPDMNVIVPGDYNEARSAIELQGIDKGPCYIRLSRTKSPDIFPDDHQYNRLIDVVEELGSDCTVMACGTMLAPAMEAVKQLKSQGVFCTLLNVSTIKPLDTNTILKFSQASGSVVTVEEHSVIGGLGSAVSEWLTDCYPVPVKKVAVQDTFTQTGSPDELYKEYGLTTEDIVKAVNQSMTCRHR